MTSALFDAEVPAEALVTTFDLVERETASGHDTTGGAAEGWAMVYQNLPALIVPASASDLTEWAQKGIQATHKVYFGRLENAPQSAQLNGRPAPTVAAGLPTTGLPLLGVRDRGWLGTYPGTTTRRCLQFQWVEDVAEAGVMLEASAIERRPG
jgi:hypothetical protein